MSDCVSTPAQAPDGCMSRPRIGANGGATSGSIARIFTPI